jgi:serine/threonine protein phosphatase PrpC
VNDHLFRRSTSDDPVTDRCGSTLVVLLTRGPRLALLWAGDSRVYRWREGQMIQLSRDHSLEAMTGTQSSVITRAVGVQSELVLDSLRDGILPGDRFLLCSDGLTRVVPDAVIADLVATPDLEEAVDGLIGVTLDAGAPDNVTVLLVEALQ